MEKRSKPGKRLLARLRSLGSEYDNELEIAVFATRRNGHHAFMNWACAQVEGTYCHLNDTRINSNPFRTTRGAVRFSTNIKGFAPSLEALGLLRHKQLLMYNFEDFPFDVPVRRMSGVGSSRRYLRVLVLRDPFNQFASRLQGLRHLPRSLRLTPVVVEIWKAHAREFLGETNHLGEKLCVAYNRWHADRSYRQEIAEKIGLRFTDKGRSYVSPAGSGSSFDGARLQNRGEQMQVGKRYEAFLEDSQYLEVFRRNPDLFELSRAVFGELPAAEEVRLRCASVSRYATRVGPISRSAPHSR